MMIVEKKSGEQFDWLGSRQQN